VLEDAAHLLPAVNAVGRALPSLSLKSKGGSHRVQLLAVLDDGTVLEPSDVVTATLHAARASAALVDTPPSDLNPEAFAKEVKAVLSELKVKVTEIAGDKLLERGLGGIHAVGRGATSKPRMLVATYEPPAEGRAPKRKHIALVGKGVTFDTGGLHIKARGGMEGMKADMGGAAAVFGAFRVLVETGSPHTVSLVLCMAENAVASASYKPDDVLTLHSGKTVEINNTDAEGRLLLGDGVSWAARELKANVVIDAATLTGAQLIATGLVHAAVVSNDAEIEATAIAAGYRSGDLAHPLPFAPELYAGEFRSPLADMRNSVANRMNAQSSCAAQFVYNHLSDAPGHARRGWCHIDLAGPAFPKDRATGYGVALISELVRSL
ncbi:MAG: M17 family metallopeptidase, partial [Myxococcota bacterium]